MSMNFSRTLTRPRPGTLVAFAALVAALCAIALFAATGSASGSGGLSSGGGGTGGPSSSGKTEAKYARLWDKTSAGNKRWARKTSYCESGGDPKAIGGGGAYRGAFMFLRSSWKSSPKSPGGDPIAYSYRTQAVVAVHLKMQVGTGPWPVCG
jgi:hypothetical protein